MTKPAAVIKIFGTGKKDGQFLGAGFFASIPFPLEGKSDKDDSICLVTCAHVLYGNSYDSIEQNYKLNITGHSLDNVTATVIFSSFDTVLFRDIAILIVQPSVLDLNLIQVHVLEFAVEGLSQKDELIAFGFPDTINNNCVEQAVTLSNKVKTIESNKYPISYEITSNNSGDRTFSGFSGGPIINLTSGKVVGLVISEYDKEAYGTNSFFMYPIYRIFEPLEPIESWWSVRLDYDEGCEDCRQKETSIENLRSIGKEIRQKITVQVCIKKIIREIQIYYSAYLKRDGGNFDDYLIAEPAKRIIKSFRVLLGEELTHDSHDQAESETRIASILHSTLSSHKTFESLNIVVRKLNSILTICLNFVHEYNRAKISEEELKKLCDTFNVALEDFVNQHKELDDMCIHSGDVCCEVLSEVAVV